MKVKTFGDILKGHQTAQVSCLYKGHVVRKLSRGDGCVIVDPMIGLHIHVPDETPLKFEPWMMDRGNLTFRHDDMPGQDLKFCGEADKIVFEDGTTDDIRPHDDLVAAALKEVTKKPSLF